jgi:ABC-type Co2+ transport system permease subunit
MDDFIDPHLLAMIQGENRRRATRLGTCAVIAGAIGTALEFLNQCSLLEYPPGSSIRPIGTEFGSIFLTITTGLVALPLAVSAIMVGRRWLLGIAGLILGICPFVVTVVIGRFLITAQELDLKP